MREREREREYLMEKRIAIIALGILVTLFYFILFFFFFLKVKKGLQHEDFSRCHLSFILIVNYLG